MSTEITFFEANYYLTLGDVTHNIGGIIGKSRAIPNDIITNKDFTDELFNKYHQCINKSKYNVDESKIIRRIKFNKNHHGLKITVWGGQNKPIPKVTYYKDNKYNLNLESLIYLNSPKLFISIMNIHIERCDDEELKQILSGDLFSYTTYQDNNDTNPYCFTKIKSKKLLKGIYLVVMKDCPSGYITCEMTDNYLGQFVYVRKDVVANRGKLTKLDIMQVD